MNTLLTVSDQVTGTQLRDSEKRYRTRERMRQNGGVNDRDNVKANRYVHHHDNTKAERAVAAAAAPVVPKPLDKHRRAQRFKIWNYSNQQQYSYTITTVGSFSILVINL